MYIISFITLFCSVKFYATTNSDCDKEGDRPVEFIQPESRYKSKEKLNILRFIPKSYEINRLQRKKKKSKSRRYCIKKKFRKDVSVYEEIVDNIDQEYKFIPILSSGETVNELKGRLDRALETDFSKNSIKPHLLQTFKNFYRRHIEILRLEEVKEGTKKRNKRKADQMEKISLPTLLKCYEQNTYNREQLFKILKAESRRFNDHLKKLRKKEKLKNETNKLMMTIGPLNQDRLIRKR